MLSSYSGLGRQGRRHSDSTSTLALREASSPAINSQTSGTRKEEKLFSQHGTEVKKLARALYALKPSSDGAALKSSASSGSNAEFLERSSRQPGARR